MTARAEYTDAEWALLYTAPIVIGAAVSYAEPGGATRELITAVLMQGTAAQRHPDNELLRAVWTAQPGTTPVQGPVPLPTPGADPADLPRELLERAVAVCRSVVALLEERSSPMEAEGFVTFLGDVAVATAQAASTGAFLGIGGVRVTTAERSAVDAVREALGLDPMRLEGDSDLEPPGADMVPDGAGVPGGPLDPS